MNLWINNVVSNTRVYTDYHNILDTSTLWQYNEKRILFRPN